MPSRDGSDVTLEQLARHTSGLPRSPIPFLRELQVVLLRGETPYDLDEAAALDSLSQVSLKYMELGRAAVVLVNDGRSPDRLGLEALEAPAPPA